VSGAFALGGVALAGLMAEIRSWREGRIRRRSEIMTLRRETYASALRRIEGVASSVAIWSACEPDGVPAATRAVWEALTSAYEVLSEVRLIAGHGEVAEAMQRVLHEYRAALQSGERTLPAPTELRAAVVREFRGDLGIPA
jgi:hypothetical protein